MSPRASLVCRIFIAWDCAELCLAPGNRARCTGLGVVNRRVSLCVLARGIGEDPTETPGAISTARFGELSCSLV